MGVVLAGAEPLLMLGEREQGSQSERAVRLLGLRRTGPAQAKSLLLSYTKAGASLVLIETAAEDEREEHVARVASRPLTQRLQESTLTGAALLPVVRCERVVDSGTRRRSRKGATATVAREESAPTIPSG
jgi:hypothetical protein